MFQKAQSYLIGVDVGGTNSDSVLIDFATGALIATSDKNLSTTTEDVSTGIYNSLKSLISNAKLSQDVEDLNSKLRGVIIGTTHFLNAIIQKRNNTATHNDDLNRVAVIRLCSSCTTDFPPFSIIENEELLFRIQGPSFFIDGGMKPNGEPFADLVPSQLEQITKKIIDLNIQNIAICGMHCNVSAQQELDCKAILQDNFAKRSYFPISFTCSHEISKKDGILERENATIINESLKSLSFRAHQAYSSVLRSLNINAPLLIFKNDGSFMNRDDLLKYPILTFSASVINSLKGAQVIYQEKNAIIVDIGGTSTDFAHVVNGAPRTTPKIYVEANIPLNYRKPLTNSIALGGGSIVKVEKDLYGEIRVTILLESVRFELKKKAVCFGGNVLTNTDFAVLNGQLQIEGANKSFVQCHLEQLNCGAIFNIVRKHQQALCNKIAEEIMSLITPEQYDAFKTDNNRIKVLLVGGGAPLVQKEVLEDTLGGIVDVKKIANNNDVANAIGACKCIFSESIEMTLIMDEENITLTNLKNKLIDSLKKNGGVEPFEVSELQCIPTPYNNNSQSRDVYMVMTGQMDWNNFNQQTNNNKQFQQMEQMLIQPTYNNEVINLTGCKFHINQTPEWLQIDPNHQFKPLFSIQTVEQLEMLAWGCALYGSGGGGSVEKPLLLLKKVFKELKKPLIFYDALSLNDDQYVAGFAGFGAPSVMLEQLIQTSVGQIGFLKLIQIMDTNSNKKVVGMSNLELGGSNGLLNLIIAYLLDIPIFDITCMPRAFPRFYMTLPSIKADRCIPIVVIDSFGNEYIIHRNGLLTFNNQEYYCYVNQDTVITSIPENAKDFPRQVEALIRNLVIYKMAGFCTISGMPCSKSNIEVEKKWFLSKYREVFELGRLMYEEICVKKKSPEEVLSQQQIVAAKVLGSGKIIQIDRQKKEGFNLGRVFVKLEGQKKRLRLDFENEFLFAWEQEVDENDILIISQTKLVTTPDIITMMDKVSGKVISQEEISFGLNVTVVTFKAVQEFTTKEALNTLGPVEWNNDDKDGYVSCF